MVDFYSGVDTWVGIEAIQKLAGPEDLNSLGHGAGNLAVNLFALTLLAVLVVINFLAIAFMPSIAVRDTRFSLARVWRTTKGARTSYFVFCSLLMLIFAFSVIGAVKIEGEISSWSFNLFHFNIAEVKEFGPDFFYFMAIEMIGFIPLIAFIPDCPDGLLN